MSLPESKKQRVVRGVVTSDKMNKTRVATIVRMVKHPVVGKYEKKHTKLVFHDANNLSSTGDEVLIAPCRPLSARKSYTLTSIIGKEELFPKEAGSDKQTAATSPSQETKSSLGKASEDIKVSVKEKTVVKSEVVSSSKAKKPSSSKKTSKTETVNRKGQKIERKVKKKTTSTSSKKTKKKK